MSTPYIGTPEHLLDMQKVSGAYDSQLERRIIDLEATADEVVAWYPTDDPLSEQLNLDWVHRRYDSSGTDGFIRREQLRTTVIRMMVDEGASLTILADKAGLVQSDGKPIKPWSDLENMPEYRGKMIIKPSDFGKQLLDRALDNITEQDLDDLYIAADCMFSSGLNYAYLAQELRHDNHGDLPQAETFVEQAIQYITASFFITKEMFHTTIAGKSPEELRTIRPLLHKLASFMGSVGFELGHMHPDQPNHRQGEAFNIMLDSIAASFLELGDDKVKNIKGTDKGDLYEMLFLMDINYLFATHHSQDFDWFARGTTARHDKPLIDNPSRRRGYDFTLSNGPYGILAQAKVNKAQEERRKAADESYRDYHPWILQLAEQNFEDKFKPRLIKKLAAYDEWLSAGMPAAGNAKLDRLVLPTAREALAACQAEQQLKPSERIIRSLDGQLTRAQKRRIMRSCGEFKKS